MTRDDIIRMARKVWSAGEVYIGPSENTLEEFAALVAAAVRNYTWTQAHWTEYEISIAAAEREACAKVCEKWGAWNDVAQDCAAAIRARGEK